MKFIDTKSAAHLLEQYFLGKDNDNPNILSEIFAKNSKVIFDIETSIIDFPNAIEGNALIAETMFSSFHNDFQHVKSYYLVKNGTLNVVNNVIKGLPWLVVMQERETGYSRVGIGHYNIVFTAEENSVWLINEFSIKIAEMQSVADSELYNALQLKLNYPWCCRSLLDQILYPNNDLVPVYKVLKTYAAMDQN